MRPNPVQWIAIWAFSVWALLLWVDPWDHLSEDDRSRCAAAVVFLGALVLWQLSVLDARPVGQILRRWANVLLKRLPLLTVVCCLAPLAVIFLTDRPPGANEQFLSAVGQRTKAIYPGRYADLPDVELGRKVIEKLRHCDQSDVRCRQLRLLLGITAEQLAHGGN